MEDFTKASKILMQVGITETLTRNEVYLADQMGLFEEEEEDKRGFVQKHPYLTAAAGAAGAGALAYGAHKLAPHAAVGMAKAAGGVRKAANSVYSQNRGTPMGKKMGAQAAIAGGMRNVAGGMQKGARAIKNAHTAVNAIPGQMRAAPGQMKAAIGKGITDAGVAGVKAVHGLGGAIGNEVTPRVHNAGEFLRNFGKKPGQ